MGSPGGGKEPQFWVDLCNNPFCPILYFTLFLYYIFPPFLQSVFIKTPSSKKLFAFIGLSLLSSIPGESVKGTAMNLSAETGSIHIRNGSLMITCDGLYLVSLKGVISLPELEKNDSLKLILGKTKTSEALWEQTLQDNGKTVDLITMLHLFAQDNIALWTNTNATVKGLSFSLVLLSPIFYCLL
uniref:Tumor necrosis factor ligand superfamily member 4 n=1 Tax=Apteryx owenii TaxID=8824 RepID=A0A8B9SBZ4_APTOW